MILIGDFCWQGYVLRDLFLMSVYKLSCGVSVVTPEDEKVITFVLCLVSSRG